MGILTKSVLDRFSKRLRDARVGAGLSQAYVSAHLGQNTDAMISFFENGHRMASRKHFKKLTEILPITMAELIDFSVEHEKAMIFDSLKEPNE